MLTQKEWVINSLIGRRKSLRRGIPFYKHGGSEGAASKLEETYTELYQLEVELNLLRVNYRKKAEIPDEELARLQKRFKIPKDIPKFKNIHTKRLESQPQVNTEPKSLSSWKDRLDYERYCVHCDTLLVIIDRRHRCTKCSDLKE